MFRKPLVRKSGLARIRCFAVQRGDQFVAVCLDLSLATQADTMEEAMRKLDDQIKDCLDDLFASGNLVSRPAPLGQWIYYWRLLALLRIQEAAHLNRQMANFFKKFQRDVPLEVKVAT